MKKVLEFSLKVEVDLDEDDLVDGGVSTDKVEELESWIQDRIASVDEVCEFHDIEFVDEV